MANKQVKIRVGQKVNAKLNDGNGTVVIGKVLKVNNKGKAVVEVPDRGKCIIPLHAITPATQTKAKPKTATKAPVKKAQAKRPAAKAPAKAPAKKDAKQAA